MQFHSFKTTEQLTQELSDSISTILLSAIRERGNAFMVVSGGKTPIDLFNALSQKELPWERVIITLADERCVDVQSPESNEHLVRNYLLQNKAKNANFISLFHADFVLSDHLQQLERTISQLPSFDVVVLGMGEDGHTASLFPCSNELLEGLTNDRQSVLLVHPQKAPFQRISLTKKRLLNSQNVFLHLVGQKKKLALQEFLLTNNPFERPIVSFLNDKMANVNIMYAPSLGENECIQ
ncbi:6-phosphogluconolactonase [Legionella waltersii]|nr:6-phosphogluconolactonase [Legionella waltersii]